MTLSQTIADLLGVQNPQYQRFVVPLFTGKPTTVIWSVEHQWPFFQYGVLTEGTFRRVSPFDLHVPWDAQLTGKRPQKTRFQDNLARTFLDAGITLTHDPTLGIPCDIPDDLTL